MNIITPRQHQKDLINFSNNNGQIGVLAWHGMGLGKTLSALWIAREHINSLIANNHAKAPKIAIFCPKSAVITWRDEIRNNVKDLIHSTLIYSISSLHHFIKSCKYHDIRFIIIDESHALKAQDTTRIEILAKLFEVMGTEGAKFKLGKIMLLTGTPMPNGAHELYTSWAICCAPDLIEAARRLKDQTRYKNWIYSFAGKKNNTFQGYDKKQKKKVDKTKGVPQGAQNIEKLCGILSLFTHYRRVSDCLDIPKAHEHYIDLGLPDDTLLENANIEEPEAYMAVVERLSRAKTPHMLGWIQEFIRINPNTQLIVFTMHRNPLDQLIDFFGDKVRIITGKESRTDRDKSIKAFRAGQFQIFGMTYKCGSESLNLQNAYNSLYHGYPWTDSTLRQAMARTYRSGQARETNHFFLTSGQNDRRVLKLVRAKQEATNSVEDELIRLERTKLLGDFSNLI
jgi:SNF2 family DNA or RNA helicase